MGSLGHRFLLLLLFLTASLCGTLLARAQAPQDASPRLRLEIQAPAALTEGSLHSDARGLRVELRAKERRWSFDIAAQAPIPVERSGRLMSPPPQKPCAELLVGAAPASWPSEEPCRGALLNTPAPASDQHGPGAPEVKPAGRYYLLSTPHNLFGFEVNGRQRFRTPLSAPAIALNATPDGRLVIAALADGSVRWFKAQDGRPLLAVTVQPGRDRGFIAWTPSGYYNAAAGSEDLLAWRAIDEEDIVFPIAHFRDSHLRPDVLRKVLFTLDEELAVTQANGEAGRDVAPPLSRLLPPIVRVLSPRDGTEIHDGQVRFELVVRSLSGQPVELLPPRILCRGARGLVVQRPPPPAAIESGERITRTLQVPAGDCPVEWRAQTQSARSRPVVVHLRWAGLHRSERRLIALTVGVSQYQDAALRLHYAAKDAADLSALLNRQRSRGLYQQVEARTLLDQAATKRAILDALERMAQELDPEDLAVVLLAGHGASDPRTGSYHYLPFDAAPDDLAATALPAEVLGEALRRLPGRVLLLLDTCHAGRAALGWEARPDMHRFINEVRGGSVMVLSASMGGQIAREEAAWSNGAFTSAVLRGLDGAADSDGSGKVHLHQLVSYVSEQVARLTDGAQTPTFSSPSNTAADFVLTRVRARPTRKQWRLVVGGLGLVVGAALLGTAGWGFYADGQAVSPPVSPRLVPDQVYDTQGMAIGLTVAGASLMVAGALSVSLP